jgi:hypothetical protein
MLRVLTGWIAPLASTIVLVAALTTTAGAFGEEGHRIVGFVAELHLRGTRALAETRRILRPQETLADAAVWPDTIKTPAYEDGETGPFRLEHPAHDTYHYTNMPFQTTTYRPDVPGAWPSDILQITRECIRVLRGSSTSFTPREAIRMLAHLVGDMHQPLHVGTGFVTTTGPLRFVEPRGATGWRPTIGGNALVYGPQDRFNLHSYWDSHIVNLAMRNDDVSAYAARLMTELPVEPAWRDSGDPDAWPERWVNDSLVYAKDAYRDIRITVYLGADPTGRIPHRWRIEQPPGYDDRSRARIRAQLAKGGYRLAALLGAIWP